MKWLILHDVLFFFQVLKLDPTQTVMVALGTWGLLAATAAQCSEAHARVRNSKGMRKFTKKKVRCS